MAQEYTGWHSQSVEEMKAVKQPEPDMRIEWFKSLTFPRIFPFALFMAFVGLEELARFMERHWALPFHEHLTFFVYPMKALTVGAALLFFRTLYYEIKWRDLTKLSHSLTSLATGVLVFVMWINVDYSFGAEGKGFDPTLLKGDMARALSIAVRLLGAVVIVPIMEELFWRSFLIRYITDKQFDTIPIGFFSWPSFVISSILFGLEHHLIIAGILGGLAYNLLLYGTKSISQCILSHGVTNLCLGIYVLSTGQWKFW